MILHSSLDGVPATPRAIAIGSFDGVHLGHRRVIERTIEVAGTLGLASTVVTFDPHPMSVLRPELAPLELSTPDRKREMVAELGVDELVQIRFDLAFSQLDHAQFEQRVLGDVLAARLVIVGSNFRYGHRAQGSIETLVAAGERLGFIVEPAPLLEMGGSVVSSSRIRDLITAGHVEQAGDLLGRAAWIEGTIVRGDGRGRELGFATANLEAAPHTAIPATGIYAGWAHVDGERFAAAISIGYNPTFSDARDRVRIEAHLLDFDRDVYGRPLRIEFTHRLRGEERYGSIEELVAQVHRDVAAVRTFAHMPTGDSAA
jgi:riboflavin kinase/FMN adenylyltransferase